MEREKYNFPDSSRIYRQADEKSAEILKFFLVSSNFLDLTILKLKESGITQFSSDDERLKARDISKKMLDDAALSIDPRIAVPTLLFAMEKYYYLEPQYKVQIPWLGTAIKTALAMIWKNLNSVKSIHSNTAFLIDAIKMAGAWEQLSLHYEQSIVFSYGESIITKDGIELIDKKDKNIVFQWNDFVAPRGLAQRTLKESLQVIWNDPIKFLTAITEVLHTSSPENIPLFQGTLFESIKNNKDFWVALYLRLMILAVAFKIKEPTNNPAIAIFEEFPIIHNLVGVDEKIIKKQLLNLFWKKDWYNARVLKNPANMVVERPIIRIDDKTFVVSIMNIMDSINSFVENSVMKYTEYTGVPLPEQIFQKYVSQPFENETIKLFIDLGWLAGNVTTNHKWLANNKVLTHKKTIPGEIDVLALSPDNTIAVLVECKILSTPLSLNKLKNISGKLGSKDDELFHAKLRKKIEWLKNTDEFKNINIMGIILVDRGRFMAQNPEHHVLEYQDLKDILESY